MIAPGVCYRTGLPTVADYDEAITALVAARQQRESIAREEYQGGCAVCGDAGHTVGSCHHDPLQLARNWTAATSVYVCYHCGYVATTDAEARRHFGPAGQLAPACVGGDQ